MDMLNDDRSYAVADYQLVRTDDGRVLMTRQLRAVDADGFNRSWRERGVPTRWERLIAAAVA
ncbi:MAG: hypothetical protein J0M02_11695 [Planctomycetes bacterium]|nr:hypothetical protein [Planctomycetota bacterium]